MTNQTIRLLSWVLCFGLLAAAAQADEAATSALSPLALLNRCYFHLTQRKLPLSHPWRAEILRGASAISACSSLLEATSLYPTGSSEGRLRIDSEESRQILRTFNDLHRTWYSREDLENNLPIGYLAPKTKELHDESEAGLHATRAMFMEGARFEEIVTGGSAMEALRSGGAVANTSRAARQQFVAAAAYEDKTTFVPIQTELVQKGELWGVRSIASNPNKRNAMIFSSMNGIAGSFPVHRSQGGGILGTRSFMIQNTLPTVHTGMNGGIVMAREFSKSVLKSFLCRDIPVVRIADVVPYVQTATTPDTPPFRTNANCMACHSTIDPLAALARNAFITHVPQFLNIVDQTQGINSGQIYDIAPSLPKESGMVDKDGVFHRRPPTGRLFYRDYRGDLKNESLTGLAQLGTALAASEDLYVCAASRYLQYFTGIHVALHDPGDPSHPPLTPAERENRDWVIRLGLDLKAHQSVKKLIKQILESSVYQSSSMRLYGQLEEEANQE